MGPQDNTQTGQWPRHGSGGCGAQEDQMNLNRRQERALSLTHPWLRTPVWWGRGLGTWVPPSHLPQLDSSAPSSCVDSLLPLPLFEDHAWPPSSPPIRCPALSLRREGILCPPLPCPLVIPHLSLLQILALALFPRPLSPSRPYQHLPVGGRCVEVLTTAPLTVLVWK